MRTHPLLYVIALSLLCGCANIQKESEEWRKQVDETKKALQASIDAMAKAIPGERYLRLLDAVRDPDPKVSEPAKKLAQSLFSISADKTYEATTWFGLTSGADIHVDAFRAAVLTEDAVRDHLRGKRLNLTLTHNALTPPLAAGALKQQVKARVDAAVNKIAGNVIRDVPTSITYDNYFQQFKLVGCAPSPGLPPPFVKYRCDTAEFPLRTIDGLDHRKLVADELLDAIWLPNELSQAPRPNSGISIEWSVLDSKQFLFVLISEEDFQKSKGNGLKVTAIVHERGKPDAPLTGERAYTFDLSEFEMNQVVVNENPPAKLRWASHSMTSLALVTADVIKAIELLKAQERAWDALGTKRNR